jgi:hypothetical protein
MARRSNKTIVPVVSNDPVLAAPAGEAQAGGYLANLACGTTCPPGAFESVYSHLHRTLSDLERLAFSLKAEDFSSQLGLFSAPLVARSIFEAALTALIGRFDPLRILIVRESQLADDYNYAKKNELAINWQNDFQGEAPKGAQAGQEPRLKVENMPRALFGKYFERALWMEAMEKLSDAAKSEPQGEWLLEVTRTEPREFIPRMRTEVQNAYSSCSKGIHQEFVIKQSEYSSRDNLKSQVGQALELTAKLALAFNCSPHVLYPVDPGNAIAQMNSLDRKWAE